MPEEQEPRVHPATRALLITGLVICMVLMCIISGMALFDFGSVGPIVILILIGLAPLTALFGVLVMMTGTKKQEEGYWARKEPVFNYTPEMLMKEYYKVLSEFHGMDLSLRDLAALRVAIARKYHPDQQPKHMRPFYDELIAFLNQLIDNLTRDVKREGHINWDKYPLENR